MQWGHLPLLHSLSGQSDGKTALNFDLKFELDCTRCLWNNYHSVQAQITLLDLIFMIMMKWSEKNVCEENKMYKYRSSHIYFLQSDYSMVICVANSHCLQNVRRPTHGSEFALRIAHSPVEFVFYKSQPLRGKWRTHIFSPVLCETFINETPGS